ncbi:MAG: hypothetical protein V2I47_12740 [Bacteroidales bacterium]|nr:hypothetical protein [Bacteroidales bacterium]
MGKKNRPDEKAGKDYLKFAVPLIIIIATLIIYNPSLKYEILNGWDDTEYLDDPSVQDQNLAEIFSNYHLGMYQPLSVFTIALNYNSSELKAGPFHATNLFLHILNIFLVWLFVFRLGKKKILAGIVAFLFALHPINVEPVVWLSARSTLLMTTFYLAGLLAYLKYTENRNTYIYLASVLFALLAFFSKSLAMSFPFVLLIVDYFRERSFSRRVWLEKAPFFVLSVIFGIVAVNAADTYGHITQLSSEYSILDRFFILCYTYVFYFVKLIVPVELSVIYAYPDMENGGLPILYYLSALVPLGVIYLIYRFWKKQKEIIAGLLFFSIAVGPVLPIFWSRIFIAADRYAYLSFIGLFIALAYILVKFSRSGKLKNAVIQYAVWGVLVVYGGFLVYLTHQQMKHWASAETLLNRAVELGESSSNKALAHFYRGNVYQNIAEQKFTTGYQTSNRNMVLNSQIYYRMTISDYDSCLVYDPGYMLAYTNRGIAYMSVSQYDTNYLAKYTSLAQKDFENAISLDSTYADNYYNLAWIYWIEKDYQRACELWHKADELGSVVAHQPLRNYCQ